MYVSAYAGYLVQADTRKRGLGIAAVTFWSVSVVFFGIVFIPLYLIFRSRSVFAGGKLQEVEDRSIRLCPHCGESNPSEQQTCGKCHKFLDENLSLIGEKQCPYCGKMNPVDTSRCKSCDQLVGIDSDED
jgi:hypothetical protein